MADIFEKNFTELESPVSNAAAITPNDSTDLTQTTRAIYIGGSGNLTVQMAGGQEITFVGLIAGIILPIRVRKVKTSSTTTNLVALY